MAPHWALPGGSPTSQGFGEMSGAVQGHPGSEARPDAKSQQIKDRRIVRFISLPKMLKIGQIDYLA